MKSQGLFAELLLGQVKLIFSLAGLYENEDAGCGVFILFFMIFWVDAVPFLFSKSPKSVYIPVVSLTQKYLLIWCLVHHLRGVNYVRDKKNLNYHIRILDHLFRVQQGLLTPYEWWKYLVSLYKHMLWEWPKLPLMLIEIMSNE